MCEKRGIRDKGIVKWGRRTSRTDEIEERGGRRWTVTDGNTSSPSWLPSHRRTYGQTAKTRRTGSRKHVLRTTGPFVIPEALCSPRVHLSLSVGRWFVCADAVVSFRFLARTSSRPGSSLRVGFIPLGSASRQQQRSTVAAGPLGGLQTSRIRQIQLTRAELNRRNPLTVRSSLARSEYSALPFSFDRFSHLPSVCPSNPTFPLVLRPILSSIRTLRLLSASTTHGFPDVRSKREISEGERGSSSVEFSQSGSSLCLRTRVQRRRKKEKMEIGGEAAERSRRNIS